jgi:kynurenine formamidase
MRRIDYSRVVYLSHVIDVDIPLWPGDPPVQLDWVADWEADGYGLRRMCMGEHTGTHCNAPSSFDPRRASIDRLPARDLVAPAVVVDVRRQAAGDPDYALTMDALRTWESLHGRVPRGAIVLLCTGWDQYWSRPQAYLGAGPDGTLHFPGFGPAAAHHLLEERGAAGLGTDTHGLEPGIDAGLKVNRLCAENGTIALENLSQLTELPATGATLIVGVVKLRHGTGAPAAVLALVP